MQCWISLVSYWVDAIVIGYKSPPSRTRICNGAAPPPPEGGGDCSQVRQMETPPSTRVAVPVMKPAASEARKAAAWAISSGWAMRLRA